MKKSTKRILVVVFSAIITGVVFLLFGKKKAK